MGKLKTKGLMMQMGQETPEIAHSSSFFDFDFLFLSLSLPLFYLFTRQERK
jgi:hypothetical protein